MNKPQHSRNPHAALATAMAMALAFTATPQAFAQPQQASYGTVQKKHLAQAIAPPVKSRAGGACPYGTDCQAEGKAPADNHAGEASHPGRAYNGQARGGMSHEANAIHPIPAYGGNSRAGVSPSLGQQRGNLGSSGASQQAPSMNNPGANPVSGQAGFGAASSIPGPGGNPVNPGGSKGFKGYGSIGISNSPGTSYGSDGGHRGSIHLPNGGMAGSAEGDHSNPNFQSGQSGDNAKYDGIGANAVNDIDSDSGHPENGLDSNGTEWKDNQVYDGTDANGTKWRNGKASGGTVKPYNGSSDGGVGDDGDVGSGGQPGSLVNGNGNVVNPGHRPGSDKGGGRGQDSGTSGTGGSTRNTGTGAYVEGPHYGQDAPAKPKAPTAALDANKLHNGASDPHRGYATGGGG